jgi:hypothetical protein
LFRAAIPALYDAMDENAELEASKARVPILSGNRWTDTSNTDPGIVAIRIIIELLGRWLYSSSARYVADDIILHIASLLGQQPNPASAARGRLIFTVTPNTVLPANFQVADPVRGVAYRITTSISSTLGGTLEVEGECVTAGRIGNQLKPGAITEIRGAPTSGQVLAVTSGLFDGGEETETLETFKLRLPGLVQNDTLLRPAQFVARALENPAVVRARVLRGTRPVGTPGQFERGIADHTTMILVGPNGTAPAESVLNAVRDSILADTLFNFSDDNPAKVGLHVLGCRNRAVSVTGVATLVSGADPATAKALAEARVAAYLNVINGGQNGLGFGIGSPPRKAEIYALLENTSGIDYVLDDSVVLTNANSFALDEVVSAGAVSISVGFQG